ncbi:MAG: methylthioribulose 1-phosphate dehydratase [Halobacteriovoraceae bacterium]|nr:methylthioribulose 1-phosphate dehydratase [Halobacteriovoraceae bacterium]
MNQMTAPDRSQAEFLVELIHQLAEGGELPATSGNFSFKSLEDPNKIYLSESGVDKERFSIENLVPVTTKGELIEAGRKVSDESALHLMTYRAFEAGCILHGHPVEALHFADLYPNKTEIKISGLELVKAFAGNTDHNDSVIIPFYKNTQDLNTLATQIAGDWKKGHIFAFIIQGHGLTCWGNDVAEAKKHWQALTYLMDYELAKGL